MTQHDNLTKLATEFQKTKKFDKSFNEYFGIDAEKAFIEAQAKVKSPLQKEVSERTGKIFDPATDQYVTPSVFNRAFSLSKEKFMAQFPNIPEGEINRIMKLPRVEQEKILTQLMRGQKQLLEDFIPKGKGNAEGGLIPGYATGGVSNLFRSR